MSDPLPTRSDRAMKPLWKRRPHFRMPSAESALYLSIVDEIDVVVARIDRRSARIAQRKMRDQAAERGGYD